jgi:hypothetical protein
MLREFSGLWIVFFGGIAAWKAAAVGPTNLVYALAGLALGVGVLGLANPRRVGPIYVGWMILASPAAWLISHALLAVLFFVIFLPIGLLFRLIGRDPLMLKKPAGDTYWTAKPGTMRDSQYFRQY